MFTSELTDFTVGQDIRFWSERVFGVPVHATVTAIGRKYLTVEARYGLATWVAKIHPSRVIAE